MIVLAACGTDTADDIPEDRQFANDPAPTRAATETPAETPTEEAIDEAPPQRMATPADLLRTRGAPSTLYTVEDGALVVLDLAGDAPSQRILSLPEGAEVLGVAASPTGDRAGVLVLGEDGSPEVLFYTSSGEPLEESIGTPAATPMGTPIATPQGTPVMADPAQQASPSTISWIPQGDGVVVAHQGQVTVYSIGQDPDSVPLDGVPGKVLSAAVSPTGSQVLLHVALEDGAHSAYLVEPATGSSRELFALRTDPGTAMGQLSWLPTGNGVLFVRGDADDGQAMRGQLFVYRFRDDTPALVATSGQGGPSATITHVAISADGRSVAYVVSIRDIDQWSVHSMWVRLLKGDAPAIPVPVDAGVSVQGLAWSSEGLVWIQASGTELGELQYRFMTPDGGVHELVRASQPQATPVGTPGATPLATPIASPVATPVTDATPAPGP